MSELFSRLQAEGPQLWRQLSLVQRASLVAVGLAAVLAIVFMGQWAQQPEYSAAFTGLSETDASAIVIKLKEKKVPYQLADNGSTVRVPAEQVYDVRLEVASAGLPRGGTVGFELFDKTSFGLTDFAQKLNYQRALEGELSRTVSRISGVNEARVHLALPQKDLFIDREKPATASVVLMLKPGSDPDSKQVQGIVTLVSRSVEGLKPENVTVVDGSGVALSGQEGLPGDSSGQMGVRREAQKAYERSLQRDLQAMLEQVLGPSKAVVLVSATMDWDQYESSTETYSPKGSAAQVRSSREVTERSALPPGDTQGVIPQYPLGATTPAGPAGRNAQPAPVAGAGATSAATPQTVVTRAAAGDKGYERTETTTNYELSKLVEKTVRTPGGVKKLSVSVMLDGQLEEQTVAGISRAVTAAAGLDASRGDTVVVSAMAFDRSALQATRQAQDESSQRSLYMDAARIVLAGISTLVILLLARRAIRGLMGADNGRRLQPAPAVSVVQGGKGRPAIAAAPARPALSAETEPPPVYQEVTELAKTQPKLVAGILKTWLDER